MGLAVTVHEDTHEACTAALELLCARMGWVITSPPYRPAFGERWIGRAALPAHDNAPPRERAGR